MGIEGNEAADKLARESVNLQSITNLPPTLDDQQRLINLHYSNLWQKHWSSFSASLTSFKPHLGPATYINLTRLDQTVITRLHLRTCNFTHRHYFTKTSHHSCPHCACPMTLQHLFLTCPAHCTARIPLAQACNSNNKPLSLDTLLANTFPHSLLLNYLNATNYWNKV